MNVTPPNSGTAGAHGASSLPSASSSLADFLLAGSPANSGGDFRAIAAALFGVESTTASPALASAQQPAAAKKIVAGPQDKAGTHKSKESDDPSSATAHPEPTIPLPTLPTPLLDLGKPGGVTGPVELPDIKAALMSPSMLSGRTLTASDEKLPDTVSSQPSTSLEAVKTNTPASSLTEADTPAPTVVMSEAQKDLPPFTSGPNLIDGSKSPDGLMPAKEAAAQSPASPATGATTKENTGDGSNQPSSSDPAKPASTFAGNPGQPSLLADAPIAMNPGGEMLPAASLTSALPSVSLLEATSAASATKTLDKSMTAKPAQASGPVDPRVTAGLSDGSLLAKPAGSPKIEDREAKDRGIKDTGATSTQRGKIEQAEAANLAEGITRSAATNSKDVAGVAPGTHSDTHAKAIPVKQSVAAPSSQTAVADADGPDEALPTSTPSSVTTAKLVQDMSQSEFRVGMQTPEFGNIDIRTSVARHMFSAQISVEHSDVAKSMTADLPALYHKLADQQVPVASIVIQGQSFATSSGLAQDSQQPQTWRPQSYNVTKSDAETALPVLMETLDSAGRLDIRI